MKALKTTISITELQKTIGLWKSRKITDSAIPKLLNLYLGLTPYMNNEQVYPVENFYDISMALAFKNAKIPCGSGQTMRVVRNQYRKESIRHEILLLTNLARGDSCGRITGKSFRKLFRRIIYIIYILKGILLTKEFRRQAISL